MSLGSRDASRPRRTWPWPSGNGFSPSFPTGCCGRSGSGRPTRTGLKSVTPPEAPAGVAWELLYRLEPELYDRLAGAERLHPGGVGWLPRDVDRIAEVGAGTGRLTLELIERGRRVVAVEPAQPLRRILRRKLAQAGHGDRVRVV